MTSRCMGRMGSIADSKAARQAGLETELRYDVEHDGVTLVIQNHGAQAAAVSVLDGYSKKVVEENVKPGSSVSLHFSAGEELWVV